MSWTGSCWDDGWTPTADEQEVLATAPARVVRFLPFDHPAPSRDTAWAAFRAEQWAWLAANPAAGRSMSLRHLEWDWRRRKGAAIAALPDHIIGFHVDDWPDAPDPEEAWLQWGEARRLVMDGMVNVNGVHLDAEHRRRWPADPRAAGYDKPVLT